MNILQPGSQAIVDWGRAHNLSPNGATVNSIPGCGGTQRTGDKCRCPAGDARPMMRDEGSAEEKDFCRSFSEVE